ncbi:MAG: response regulator [Mariprofundales bacterium]|nr:response regulator [Mariprofundales bacterium]
MQIIIIDDNPTNVLLLKRMVQQMEKGEARTFLNPEEGLAWCEAHPVDLVLVDYMMPEMDGITFIQRFRAIAGCGEVPIIMVTADDDKQVRYDALAKGATDFLNKPVDKTEFIARMGNMLALRNHQKQMKNRTDWLASEVRKATAELRKREHEAIFLLSKAAEYRDPETASHIVRMAHYSQLIARNMGMDKAAQEMLLEAAPMHDVGKLGTPDRILLKPGKLDNDEFAIMKRHAEQGAAILRQSETRLMQVAADIAIMHHEKFDGSGYPNGLAGEDIAIYARIVAVADVFDALTSERPYKKEWPIEQAVSLLNEERGHHFDPTCVDALLASMDEVLAIKARFQDEAVTLDR